MGPKIQVNASYNIIALVDLSIVLQQCNLLSKAGMNLI